MALNKRPNRKNINYGEKTKTPSPRNLPSRKSPKEHPRWFPMEKWSVTSSFSLLRKLVVYLFALFGFLSALYQIAGGPPWPVSPTFSLGAPSSGEAFDIPFTITNKSAFFSITHLEIICGLDKVRTSTNSSVSQSSVSISDDEESLAPLQVRHYKCPLNKFISFAEGARIEEATIMFWTKYDSKLPFGGREQSQSDFFTLDTKTIPPRWTDGKPIR